MRLRPAPTVARLLVVAALALPAAACAGGSAEEAGGNGPAGLKLSGRVDDGPVAISDGSPRLHEGGCAARPPVPAQVCVATRGVGGTTYVFGFANLDQLPRGERVDVVDDPCTTAAACADVDGGAVVFVAVGDEVHRPTDGSLLVREAEQGGRYRGQMVLRVAGGDISGDFDVAEQTAPGGPGGGPPGGREPFTPDEVEPYDPDADADAGSASG